MESWAEELRESSPERVEEAVEWVGQTPVQSPQLQGSVVEALMLALEHSEVRGQFSVLFFSFHSRGCVACICAGR